jgi:hypothetical protein
MTALVPASEDEMVCAFLLAELDSPLWRWFIHTLLRTDVGVVTHPSVDDPAQSLVRRLVLAAYRGYGIGTYLFAGFPADVMWWRTTTTAQELGGFRYANCDPWASMAGSTRLVRDGAQRLDGGPSDRVAAVREVESGVLQEHAYPPLIAVGSNSDGDHVLVEGHTRATAYVRALAPSDEVELIVGHSATMSAWRFW